MNEKEWKLNLLPRLRFFILYGFWCPHPMWSEWEMVDLGRHKMRWCTWCHYSEFV